MCFAEARKFPSLFIHFLITILLCSIEESTWGRVKYSFLGELFLQVITTADLSDSFYTAWTNGSVFITYKMTNEQIYVQCDRSLRALGCFNVSWAVTATRWSCLSATHTLTRTHTRTHTHTHTHTRTHAGTHARTHARTHTHTHLKRQSFLSFSPFACLNYTVIHTHLCCRHWKSVLLSLNYPFTTWKMCWRMCENPLWCSAVSVSYHTFWQVSFLGLRQFLLALFHGFTVIHE